MRIAVLVDGSNMYFAQKREGGYELDWRKVRDYLGKHGEVVETVFFASTPHTSDAKAMVAYSAFRQALRAKGWRVEEKPTKRIRDRETGRHLDKANVDVELTCYAWRVIEQYDWLIIFTGDGDFACLMRELQERGKRVSCAGWAHEVAREIREAGLEVIDLAPLRQHLEYQKQRGGPL